MTPGKMKLFIGEFQVEKADHLEIVLNIGGNVRIHIHPGDFEHLVKRGDKLPLYTEVPFAKSGSADSIAGS